MECHHSFTTVLDSWSPPNYPWHSYRRSLFSILLYNIDLYTTSAIWQNIIWALHNHIKCSFWMEISTGRWRLWEQFRKLQHINSPKKSTKNPPHIQHRELFIQPKSSHTMQYCSITPQASMQMANIQFFRWQWSLRRHSTSSKGNSNRCPGIPRRRWRRRRLSDSAFRWQTLDYWGSTWQNIMHSWTCLTTQTMPISMPFYKLFTSFLCQLYGFEWHFQFWRHHDNIQQWGYTSTWGCSILRNSSLNWTLFLTLIYSITYHLMKIASVIAFLTKKLRLQFALKIMLTLPYSFTYHLSRDMYILIHFTCILTELWIAFSIIITLSYIHYSINDDMSNNICIKTSFSTILHVWFWHNKLPKYKSLLVNEVHFHLSLSGCSNGEPGNMHPCNSNAWIT